MNRMRSLIAAAICALAIASPRAAASYFYKEIESTGKQPVKASCIFAQTRGYIWLGSAEGVTRISPNENRVYLAGKENGNLPGNLIYHISEDPDGRIWAFTDKGAAIYNPVTDRFDRQNSAEQPLYCTLKTEDGFYAGGENKIFRYNCSTGRFTDECSFKTDEPFNIEAIYPTRSGSLLLVNNARGILVYNPTEKAVTESAIHISGSQCIFVDSYERVWRSEFNKGLECYDSNGKLLQHFTTENSSLSSNVVLCITQEEEGDVWAGTDGGGINIISPTLEIVTILGHSSGTGCTLPDNSISILHPSAGRIVWAEKANGGLLQVKDCHLRTYFLRPSGVRSINISDIINCICKQENSDNLWFGSHGSGLVRFNMTRESLRTFPATENFEIVSVTNLTEGKLLISALNTGLFIFNTEDYTLTDLPARDAGLENWIKYSGKAVNLSKDSDGYVLILANELYKYDPATQRISKPTLNIPHDPGHHVREVYNSGGRYYVSESNVCKWTGRTNSIDILVPAPEGTEFRSAAMGVDGTLWVATSKGLANYNPVNEKFKIISSELVTEAESVICSDDGNVWVGTDGYLFAYLPGKGNFVSFDEFDGVTKNNFRPESVAGIRGKILMAGDNGYTIIEPAQSFNSVEVPDLEVADFYVDGERASKFSGIRVPYTHNNVTIDVLAKEKNIFRKKNFKFLIKGPDGKTETITDIPVLTAQYGHPGRYRISAACTLKDGNWSDYRELCSFKVEAPWMLSWWFFTLLFLTMGFLFFLITRYGKLKNALPSQH